jgi:hypothetical protein
MLPSKELVDEWDAKLAASGFVDIERGHSDILRPANKTTARVWHGKRTGDADLHAAAYEYTDVRPWSGVRSRLAWALYANGVGMDRLRKQSGASITKALREFHEWVRTGE